MKLTDFTNKLSKLEIATLVIFIIYIVFPLQTPTFLSGVINTPVGLVVVLVITLFLFFYTNPILGVVFIFVAYELIRRTSLVKVGAADNYIVRSSPSEIQKAAEMSSMNPVRTITLEEDVIAKLAPAQTFHHDSAIDTGYKPVQEKLKDASLYR
jgi:hypothetical protein